MLQKPYVAGDWLIEEGALPVVTRESGIIDNSAGGTDLYFAAGYPFVLGTKNANGDTPLTIINQGAEATVTCLSLYAAHVPAGTKLKVPVLARGPAAINRDRLAQFDSNGATSFVGSTHAFNMATLATNIAANMVDCVVRRMPAQFTEQVT
jgi:hypothetical protein